MRTACDKVASVIFDLDSPATFVNGQRVVGEHSFPGDVICYASPGLRQIFQLGRPVPDFLE
jgi:hypothetical protein